jgi:hypothetical protein
MPAAPRRTSAEPVTDPYADLPVPIRRANLQTHRQALLSDRMAQELHAERLTVLGDEDGAGKVVEKVARFDELLADVDARLEALPAAEPPADDGDGDK